jgi:hypothetical protein
VGTERKRNRTGTDPAAEEKPMAYYVEYTVAPGPDQEPFEVPVSSTEPGYTVPLTETDAPTVSVPQLPVRSGVYGSNLAEAKAAAEELIAHSRATSAVLYEDADNSLEAGAGRLVASYDEGSGWI